MRSKLIEDRHPEVVDMLLTNFEDIIHNYDYIIEDTKHNNTVFILDKRLNLVIKLSVGESNKELLNSIITTFKIRKNQISKMLDKDLKK